MKTITKSDVYNVIKEIPNSAIFSVTFTKKDGSERKMNCRAGVKKYLTPNPTRAKVENPKNLKTVYDLKAKGYRIINLDTVKRIATNGEVFNIQ